MTELPSPGSQIGDHPGRKRSPKGVEDGQDIDDLLGDRPADRIQMAGGGEDHPDDTERHAANGALEGNRPHPAADMHEFVDLPEGVVHDDDPGSLGGDIAVLYPSGEVQ